MHIFDGDGLVLCIDCLRLSFSRFSNKTVSLFSCSIKNAVSAKRQASSYRAEFVIEGGDNANTWTTIRIPFSNFKGYGSGCEDVPFDITTLRRLGVVARGNDRIVYLALSRIGFYSVI